MRYALDALRPGRVPSPVPRPHHPHCRADSGGDLSRGENLSRRTEEAYAGFQIGWEADNFVGLPQCQATMSTRFTDANILAGFINDVSPGAIHCSA